MIQLRGRAAADLAKTSRFASLPEASQFFEPGSLGYSVTDDKEHLDGLILKPKTGRREPTGWRLSKSWRVVEVGSTGGFPIFRCANPVDELLCAVMSGIENPALKHFVASIGQELLLAQALIRRAASGYELRHCDDHASAAKSLRPVALHEARALAQYTSTAAFRPLT